MYSIENDKTTGIIKISDQYQAGDGPQFILTGSSYSLSFLGLEGVEKFKTFTYSTTGTMESRYLETDYRISRDTVSWTKWMVLEESINNFPLFDPKDLMYIDIRWTRAGSSPGSTHSMITLTGYSLQGTIKRDMVDGESTIILNNTTATSSVIKPPFIYKVFKIIDIEILSSGDISNTNIKYRFSQDYGRTVTQWEPFTKENMTTVRITPIRFFQIEYLIEYNGSSSVKIFDINLIGDFQNVTLDSKKTNVHGTRQNCTCLMLGIVDGVSGASTGDSATNMLSSFYCDVESLLVPLSADDISKLYKPYQQTQAVNLLNKLGADSNQMFGHEVVYFLTDPDKRGTDYTFHEYQLYNYICSEMIKISVDGNNFPDSQIAMNQYDLSLFDSFEVHIPKDTFKAVFGVEKRPSKEDFLWFCDLNRMFQVEHAQQFRNFNNSALYYKVMLKKYVQKSNVIGANKTIADKVKELTKNSTIDELFGLENDLDKKDVSMKEQFRPLTRDILRVSINADIDKELIENSNTIISKTNYDLASVTYQTTAVSYRNFREYFKVSDNIGFSIWFSINNYTVNDVYNFITYYDDSKIMGFKINLESDNIKLNLNSVEYDFPMGATGNADALLEDTWYCYVVNIDQRQRKLNQWIYKRNVDDEIDAPSLSSTILRKVYSQEIDFVPVEFELENTNITILGSDMKATNIRLFNDIIPEVEHNRLLNQAIIGEDYKYLIFADNANNRLSLPNYPLNQVDTHIIRGEIKKEDIDDNT